MMEARGWSHLAAFVPFVIPFTVYFSVLLVVALLIPLVVPLVVVFFLLFSPVIPLSSLFVVRTFFFALAVVSAADVARLCLPRVVNGSGEPLRQSPLLVFDGALVLLDCLCIVLKVCGK